MKLIARIGHQGDDRVVLFAPHLPHLILYGWWDDPVGPLATIRRCERQGETLAVAIARRGLVPATSWPTILSEEDWHPTQLDDFIDAANAEDHLAAIAGAFTRAAIAQFIRDAGSVLRANLRVELVHGAASLAAATAIRRFLLVAGGLAMRDALDEIAAQDPVEQVVAFEHALERAIALALDP